MNQSPHQTSLRDLVRSLRAHRVLLASVIVIAIGASVAYSVTQTPKYESLASVGFSDPSRDLGIAGLAVAPSQTAAQLAASNVPTTSRPEVVAAVRRSLRTDMSTSELRSAITAYVEPSSTLVVILATARNARDSQRIANAFARESAKVANRLARRTFAEAARELRRTIAGPCRRTTARCRQIARARALYDAQLVRLNTLSAIASPAKVADVAKLPDSPASPRPLRNAFLGGIAGLIFGLLAVFGRDAFDRRLRSIGEIEAELDVPLLGHVRNDAMGQSPNPDATAAVAVEDWELFRILQRNLDFLHTESPLSPVAVTSAVPEEGKTTVASFLAFASAAAGRRTLLMECDLRRPVIAGRLGIRPSPGVTDYVTGDAEPRDILQVVTFDDPASVNGSRPALAGPHDDHGHMHELVCITAGSPTHHPVEILASERFKAMLEQVCAAYDVVFLDTPPMLSVVDPLELLPQAAAVIVCVRASRTTREQARAGKAALARLPERPTGLVVTGTSRADDAVYGHYGYYGYNYSD